MLPIFIANTNICLFKGIRELMSRDFGCELLHCSCVDRYCKIICDFVRDVNIFVFFYLVTILVWFSTSSVYIYIFGHILCHHWSVALWCMTQVIVYGFPLLKEFCIPLYVRSQGMVNLYWKQYKVVWKYLKLKVHFFKTNPTAPSILLPLIIL